MSFVIKRMNQLLASRNMTKGNNELDNKVDWLQMHIICLKFFEYVLEENSFSRSHSVRLQCKGLNYSENLSLSGVGS